MPKPLVVVVTSHVVSGSVGARAAVFALERLGFPVWSLPTVILPWHPGRGPATRLRLDPVGFAGAVSDLSRAAAGIGEVAAVLTGYFGDATQIEPVAELVALIKARNPQAVYLCDPVIGDGDGLFRPGDVVAGIRDRLLPLADIATPNRHELMWLLDTRAADNDELAVAAAGLGPKEVVVTSAFAPPGEAGLVLTEPGGVHLAVHAAVGDAPHGTGDLFAALYLGRSLDGAAPPVALERAAASTMRLAERAAELGVVELPLAEAQDALVAPPPGVTVARFGRV
jgi:pyridoxine kinase